MVELFLGGLADFCHVDVEMKGFTCERVIAIDGDVFAVNFRHADDLGAFRPVDLELHAGREVVDAFYVLRENGRRVEAQDEIDRTVGRVTAAVEALDEG